MASAEVSAELRRSSAEPQTQNQDNKEAKPEGTSSARGNTAHEQMISEADYYRSTPMGVGPRNGP